MGKYPALVPSQRELLFDIVKLSLESGPRHERIWLSLADEPELQVFSIMGRAAEGPSRGTRGDYPTLEVLQDRGYIRMYPRQKQSMLQIALTKLALDYHDWYKRPRLYRALSSWWAHLSGEERGVIIALVVPPLAGALFRLGQELMRRLLAS